MSLDNPKNIWEAVGTLIDIVRQHETEIELLKAKLELLEIKKADRAGPKRGSRRAKQDTEAGAIHENVRKQQGSPKGNGQVPAEEGGQEVR